MTQQEWDKCDRGDLMLGIIRQSIWVEDCVAGQAHKKLILACCACARLVLHLVPESDLGPLECLVTAESYAIGKKNLCDLGYAKLTATMASNSAKKKAYSNQDDVDLAIAYSAYGYAADAAACAADAINYASDVALYASWAHCTYDARMDMLAECAKVIRRFYPEVPTHETRNPKPTHNRP